MRCDALRLVLVMIGCYKPMDRHTLDPALCTALRCLCAASALPLGCAMPCHAAADALQLSVSEWSVACYSYTVRCEPPNERMNESNATNQSASDSGSGSGSGRESEWEEIVVRRSAPPVLWRSRGSERSLHSLTHSFIHSHVKR